MMQKIKRLVPASLLLQLRDVRVLVFLVFGVLVVMATWSGIRVIETNYRLERQIARLQQEITVAELENSNVQLRNEYLNTDEYLELQARKQYSKGLPGETLVLIPKEVALEYVSSDDSVESDRVATVQAIQPKPWYQQNLEAWRDFLLGRGIRVD